jgi:hypothetical protein
MSERFGATVRAVELLHVSVYGEEVLFEAIAEDERHKSARPPEYWSHLQGSVASPHFAADGDELDARGEGEGASRGRDVEPLSAVSGGLVGADERTVSQYRFVEDVPGKLALVHNVLDFEQFALLVFCDAVSWQE